jgi:hypothetical protein
MRRMRVAAARPDALELVPISWHAAKAARQLGTDLVVVSEL